MGVARVRFVVVALGLAMGAALAPVGASAVAAPVAGAVDAFRGVPLPPGTPPPRATDDWFFEGNPLDQASKVATAPTATFVRKRPKDNDTIEQTGTATASADSPGDPESIFWTGEFSGTIRGEVELRWFWSSLNPAAFSGRDVEITFFADPTPGEPPVQIGRGRVGMIAGRTPVFNRHRVFVDGAVARTLLIQVKPIFADASSELRVSYGSSTYPSSFGVPRPGSGPPATTRPSTRSVPFNGQPLGLVAPRVGRDAAEPTIGVTKEGHAFYAASTFDGPGGLNRTLVMRSADGGSTWAPTSPHVVGATGPTLPPSTSDPYVYVDETTGRVFSIDLYLGCSYLVYSDDGGKTWSQNQAACGEIVNDHQTIVAARPPPGITTSGYPNVVYYCFNRVTDADCGRSLDGGRTFLPTTGTAFIGFDDEGTLCGGLHGHIRADSKGRLFLPKGHCRTPWVAFTEDGGANWTRVKVTDKVTTAGAHINIAVDEADNVYVTWWDAEFKLPYLAVSRDHGRTWGTPILVAPPGVKEANFPSIAAGAEGRIIISFPGTTSERQTPFRPWNSYVIVSTNALSPEPLFLSATANPVNDPIHRGACEERCGGMLDFLDAVVAPAGEAWATATDTCTSTAECITNNGPAVPGAGVAQSREGVAIRQVCGPALRGPARDLDGAGCVSAAAAPPAPPPAGDHPPTGGSGGASWLVVALGLGSLLLLVRRASRSA